MKAPQSQCVWENQQNGQFYLLNNETGEKTRVHKTGEYIKQFNAELTGQVGYQERIKKANGNPGFMPFKASSLNFDEKKVFYTPQMDKFEGYTQFPSPRTQPYYNQQKELKLNPRKRHQIEKQEAQITFQVDKNKTIFSYKGIKKSSVGTSFITGTIADYQNALIKKEIPVLKHMSHACEKEKINESLNGTKIINDRVIQPPNVQFLEKTIKKQSLENTISPQKSQEKISINDIISQKRYIEKVKSINQKSFAFTIVPEDVQQKMIAYSTLENTRTQDLNSIQTKIGGLQTKTFEKQIKINFNKNQNNLNVKNSKHLEQDLLRKKQEFEGFKLPEIQEKNTVVTKGRFGYNIPSDKQQNDEIRRIMLINYPEMFKEKINEKKKKQEKMRRELLKQVVQDMLNYNERHNL